MKKNSATKNGRPRGLRAYESEIGRGKSDQEIKKGERMAINQFSNRNYLLNRRDLINPIFRPPKRWLCNVFRVRHLQGRFKFRHV